MSKHKPKSTKPDQLVKPGKKTEIELSESDLALVSGGDPANKTTTTTSGPTESISLNFTKIEYH